MRQPIYKRFIWMALAAIFFMVVHGLTSCASSKSKQTKTSDSTHVVKSTVDSVVKKDSLGVTASFSSETLKVDSTGKSETKIESDKTTITSYYPNGKKKIKIVHEKKVVNKSDSAGKITFLNKDAGDIKASLTNDSGGKKTTNVDSTSTKTVSTSEVKRKYSLPPFLWIILLAIIASYIIYKKSKL